MKFKLKADATISAENIDAALLKIAEHFRKIVEDNHYDQIILDSGIITIEPGYSEGFTPRENQNDGPDPEGQEGE